jgi:alpha-glucoside transport system permease protein
MINDIIVLAITAIVMVPAILTLYIFLAEQGTRGLKPKTRTRVMPWLWLLPAISLVTVFLVYPAINTIALSFMNYDSSEFVGFENYRYIFTDSSMLLVLRNNLLWLVFFTAVTVVLGLLVAVLTDRVRYEVVAKAIIFIPYAISFVAAGVIWKFMYAYSPAGTDQIGTVNAVLTGLNSRLEPVAWLINRNTNNLALIFVGVWMWTGFATVNLSAALKSIPEDTLEAARIDGANEVQIFFRVMLPQLMPTVTVVTTTLVINVLKIFDIVYVMTNGEYGTEVIANRMYKELFNFRNFGRASALAVILLFAIIPVMVFNIRRFGQGRRA